MYSIYGINKIYNSQENLCYIICYLKYKQLYFLNFFIVYLLLFEKLPRHEAL